MCLEWKKQKFSLIPSTSPYRRFPQFSRWRPQSVIGSCDRFFHNSPADRFFPVSGWLKGRIFLSKPDKAKVWIIVGPGDKFHWNVCSSSAISLYHSLWRPIRIRGERWGCCFLIPRTPRWLAGKGSVMYNRLRPKAGRKTSKKFSLNLIHTFSSSV